MAISEHLSIQHLRCRYKPGKSGIIIVDGRGRLRVELTKIYWSIARGSSDASARSVVSALHRFLMWADHLSLDFRADHDKIKQVVDLILDKHYGVEVTGRLGIIRTVYAGGKVNTVKAFLQGLRTGFGLLGEMGVRGGRNPIKHYRGISNKLSRHGSVAQTGGVVPANALLGGYRITGTRPIPPEVAESTAVPDAMWEAFKMVKASLRDQSYFKALASTTARNAEIGSATFAGFAAGFGETFLVRNKGQGPTAIKAVRWDADAQQAYRLYFELERMQHDPLTPKFRRWAAKCHLALTPEHYLEFLIAARQDLTTVPLFLTERGHPYSAATFRRGIWTAAKAVSTIKAAPHHLRHANVNLRLQAVWNDFGAEPHLYVGALIEYVKEMGWRCWQTLAHYDYRGVATHALNEHYSPKNKRFRVDHGGLGGELMDRVHDDMIHAPTRSSTQ